MDVSTRSFQYDGRFYVVHMSATLLDRTESDSECARVYGGALIVFNSHEEYNETLEALYEIYTAHSLTSYTWIGGYTNVSNAVNFEYSAYLANSGKFLTILFSGMLRIPLQRTVSGILSGLRPVIFAPFCAAGVQVVTLYVSSGVLRMVSKTIPMTRKYQICEVNQGREKHTSTTANGKFNVSPDMQFCSNFCFRATVSSQSYSVFRDSTSIRQRYFNLSGPPFPFGDFRKHGRQFLHRWNPQHHRQLLRSQLHLRCYCHFEHKQV